jgi:hypothetical protein
MVGSTRVEVIIIHLHFLVLSERPGFLSQEIALVEQWFGVISFLATAQVY